LLVKDGHKVLVLGQPPRFPRYDRSCEITAGRISGTDCRALSESEVETNVSTNHRLRQITSQHRGARYFDVGAALCIDGKCSPYINGFPAYFDASHLSMVGSQEIGAWMLKKKYPNPFLAE